MIVDKLKNEVLSLEASERELAEKLKNALSAEDLLNQFLELNALLKLIIGKARNI